MIKTNFQNSKKYSISELKKPDDSAGVLSVIETALMRAIIDSILLKHGYVDQLMSLNQTISLVRK